MDKREVILGIDVDITKMAISAIEYKTGAPLLIRKIVPTSKFYQRNLDIIYELRNIFKRNEFDIIFAIIEDHAFLPAQRMAFKKGEILGLVKYLITIYNIPYLKWLSVRKKGKNTYRDECMCSPSQLKKFVFGNGRVSGAGKSSKLMLRVFQATGYEFASDDECDAFMLAQAGRTFLYCYEKEIKELDKIKILQPESVISERDIYKDFKLSKNQFEPIKIWLENQICF